MVAQKMYKLDKLPKNTVTITVHFSWRYKLRFWLGVRLLGLLAWLWNADVAIVDRDELESSKQPIGILNS